MSKATILILCPSGHRRKVQMTPNSNLLQALEDMCNQETLDSSEWGLIQQRKKCDLTIPWRLLAIPTNALLEMYKLDERRAVGNVTVQLQLQDNSRHAGSFEPTVTLVAMLEWYRHQPDSVIAALERSINDIEKLFPVCSYMSEEIIGTHALSNTTLRDLGLTSGAAMIRYSLRSITDDDLAKINARINEKIARRRPPSSVTKSEPEPVSTFDPPPRPIITAPLFNSEEFSIFRDHPVSLPQTTTQSRTLAEALGLRISLDSQTLVQQPSTDFSDFKFPETTKDQNLYENTTTNDFQRSQGAKSCDRHSLVYDLTKIQSTRENQSEEIPDSFFELTPDDLRSVLHGLRQQGDDGPLETRSMRERVQSARAVQYQHIAIRFVVNSTYILQGLFYPNEPISHLIEFVRVNLVCPQLHQADFYLYTSPPRILLSNLTKSLSAYDLAPATYVYLGHRTASPLTIQLASIARIGTIDEANELVTQYVFNRTRPMNQDEVIHSMSSERLATTTTTTTTSSTIPSAKRNAPAMAMDDKQLKDKFRKFLPGKK